MQNSLKPTQIKTKTHSQNPLVRSILSKYVGEESVLFLTKEQSSKDINSKED